MAGDLIQRVKTIEAEADRIVAQAHKDARQVEQSFSDEAEALRESYEDAFRRETEAFKAEEEQRVAREQAELDEKARKIADVLQSVNAEATGQAVEVILKHLREG